jgi:predicted small secreted protein
VAAVGTIGCRTPLLNACYTACGAGEDLNAAGKSIEHSADKNTNY